MGLRRRNGFDKVSFCSPYHDFGVLSCWNLLDGLLMLFFDGDCDMILWVVQG